MMQFENIKFFYTFLFVPAMVLLFVFAINRKKKSLKKFGDYSIIKQLMPEVSTTKNIFKFIFFTLAFCFTVAAIINPQFGSKTEDIKQEGIDLIIALDVSNSMKAEDLQPNRLECAKQAISKLINGLKNDRVGIIVFGGEAYVQLPITTDYNAGKLFLQAIDNNIVPTQGTAIGAAIDLGIESFQQDDLKNKSIIVISDGENHEDDAMKSARAAAEKGITIHTIGMGSEQGAPIPVYKNKIQTGFRKDKEGNTVITKLNEQMLGEIAQAGNGMYVRATQADAGLNAILSEINKMQKKQFASKRYVDFEDQFQWFIIGALFFLILDVFVLERKNRWFAKLNLFGEKKINS